MILLAIAALSFVVLAGLLALLRAMPVIPETFVAVFEQVYPHIRAGVLFINDFMYPAIVWPLAGVCLALHTFWTGYRIYMWVVKKIPMFGVSD